MIQFQNFNDYIALFFLIFLNAVFEFHISKKKYKIYDQARVGIISPPGYWFFVIWKFLYSLITVSIFLYGWILSPNSSYYVATMTIYFIFIIMCKMWPLIYFEYYMFKLGAVLCAFIFSLSLVITALIGSEWNNGIDLRIAFFFFIPMNIWLLYATFLSVIMIRPMCAARALIMNGKQPMYVARFDYK